MILEDYKEIRVSNNMVSYYQNLGYEDAKTGKFLTVKNSDIPKNSHIEELRRCDNCGKEFVRTHRAWETTRDSFNEDVCVQCVKLDKYFYISQEKQKNTTLLRYGVEWVSQNKENREKAAQTSLKRYGVTNYNKTEEAKARIATTNLKIYGCKATSQAQKVKDKAKATNLERYGTEWTQQNSAVRQKSVSTLLERYGVENPSLSKEIQQKRQNTFIEKYGCINPGQVPEIKEKIHQSLYNNGTIATSQQQKTLLKLLEQIYPDYQFLLNYPVSRCNLDIALLDDSIKLDIEYDGWYWHQHPEKDRARDEFMKKQGYKILRIKSGCLMPNIEDVKQAINELLATKKLYKEIILDDWRNNR